MNVKAIYTLSEMLHDRGYQIHYIDNTCSNQEDYVIHAIKHSLNGDSISNLFCFICEDKLNIKVIKDKICFSKNHSADCIIVYKDDITTTARKTVESFDIQIELFSIYDLQFNKTLHRLVPHHELASEKEIAALEGTKIQILLASDPIVRYYKFKKGSIVKITRKNGIVSYRQVKS